MEGARRYEMQEWKMTHYVATQWPGFCEEIQMKRNNMEPHMITASPDKASLWGIGYAQP